MIDTYCTDGKITFVGNKFIDGDGDLWGIIAYSKTQDSYLIIRCDTQKVIGGRLDAKSFRKAWLNNTIQILGDWWLPK